MSDVRGLPLLSGPPPNYEQADACRRCNKEFNIILTRSRRCNHCGYHYCHSCTDFQALMPRTNEEGATGYSAMSVCAYCIEHLNVTASGKGQLKTMPLAKLKKYIEVYSIKAPRAVEKEDLVEAILAARGPNGCLLPQNEMYYRRNSVPNRFAGARPRGIFSRVTQEPQPPPRQPPPPTNRQTYPEFARPDLAPDDPPQQQQQQQYAPPPHPPPPPQPQYNSYRPSYQPPPHPPPGHGYPPPPPPNHFARPTPPPPVPPPHNHYYTPPPPPPGMNYQPRYHPPPVPPRPQAQAPFQQPHAHTFPRTEPPTPPQASRPQTRSASAQPPEDPRPRATSTAPPPSLDELLDMTTPAISSLSIGQLKAILFKNHVNVGVVLEKSDLVTKVRKLLDDERKERQAQRAREEAEEAERIERQRRILEEAQKEKKEKERRERMERGEVVSDDEDDDGEGRKEEKKGDDNDETKEEKAGPSTPPKAKGTAADLERTGLCVICQDEEANIAIVDCGHLAMCRGCSDLIMNSSRECPLCRTRIVTEARLLRIFKS